MTSGGAFHYLLVLTPGAAHDNRLAGKLLASGARKSVLLADRGYDADRIREFAIDPRLVVCRKSNFIQDGNDKRAQLILLRSTGVRFGPSQGASVAQRWDGFISGDITGEAAHRRSASRTPRNSLSENTRRLRTSRLVTD
jgi:hypothetical protein